MPDLAAGTACPECGCILRPDAPRGLCAKCLLTGMLDGDFVPSGTILLPREFGAYVLLEEVARGGMGIVYKARQPLLNRTVAVKVMAGGQFAAPDFVERFRTEADAAASLDHPNIVPVHEAGECEGHPFFSMMLVEGRSLAQRLADDPSPFPGREAALMIAKLSHAVHYAHQRGILHRDIKPGNVLLDAAGEPHLTDFGLAKLVEKDSALTRTMAMLGTPSYMSPEQARGEAKQLTTAVDVYGLGAIFYELLTGKPPFEGGTPMDTVRQVLEKEPRRPSQLRQGLDPDLETICLKCLEKEAAHRYSSAESLATDIERWVRHEPILARPAPASERVAKWIRRHRALGAALAAIAALLIAGVTVSLWQAVRATRAEELANRRLDESRENEQRAGKAGREAQNIAEQRRRELVKMHVAAGNRFVDEGNALTALLNFVEALRLDEGDPLREDTHRRRIATVMQIAPRLKQLWAPAREGPLSSARFHPDGRRVLCSDEERRLQVYDGDTGEPVNPPVPTDLPAALGWFTRDGRYLVSVDEEGRIRHWDAATGAPAGQVIPSMVRSILGRTYSDAVDYSPDRDLLIAIVKEGVRFFSVPSGEPSGPLLPSSGAVSRVRFSPDGRTVSICGKDPSLQIVDVASGQVVWTPPQPAAPLRLSAFSPDGRTLFTMTEAFNPDYDIWDLERGERRMETMQKMPFSYDAKFTPDGKGIVLGSVADAFIISAETGKPTGEVMKNQSHVTQYELSGTGSRLATASYDKTARIWDVPTGRALFPILPHARAVNEVSFSPDGKRLLTASGDGTVRLWELGNGNGDGSRVALSFAVPGTCNIVPAPGGHLAGAYNSTGAVQIWDTRSGRTVSFWNEDQMVTEARFNRDGTCFFVAAAGGTVHCREAATGREIFSVHHSGSIECLEFSPDGSVFLTAGDEGTVRLWNAGTGAPVTCVMRHEGTVRCAAFSADGLRIVTGGEDKTVRVWNARSGEPALAPLKLETPALTAAFNKDGSRILTLNRYQINRRDLVMRPGTTQLWDAKTLKEIGSEWPLLSHARYPAAFSPDGGRFLKAEDTSSVAICDSATGRRIAPLLQHIHYPTWYEFSPDGNFVMTTAGNTARIWDAQSGEPVSPPLLHKENIACARWSIDGRALITAQEKGGILLWDVSPADASLTQLTQYVELLSAHHLDPQIGTVALTPAELRERWKAMKDRSRGP